MNRNEQGTQITTAIAALIATLVILQLWLLSASVDALASGADDVLVPAAIASAVLLIVNGVLLLHAVQLDRRLRHARQGR